PFQGTCTMLTHALRRLFRNPGRSARRAAPKARATFRLQLLALEDRVVPSTATLDSAGVLTYTVNAPAASTSTISHFPFRPDFHTDGYRIADSSAPVITGNYNNGLALDKDGSLLAHANLVKQINVNLVNSASDTVNVEEASSGNEALNIVVPL